MGSPRLSCLSSPLFVRMMTLTTSPHGRERGKGFLWSLLIRSLFLSGELPKDLISKYHLTGQWSYNIRIWKQRAQSLRHPCRVGSWNVLVCSVRGLTGKGGGIMQHCRRSSKPGDGDFLFGGATDDLPSSFLLATSELQKWVVWWRNQSITLPISLMFLSLSKSCGPFPSPDRKQQQWQEQKQVSQSIVGSM